MVAKGFQEKEKVQSDSPTVHKDSMKLFFAMAAIIGVETISSLDITAAFLQAETLKRNVFVDPPKDVKEEGILWKLKKPLYGLNDAGRRFWIRVKKILMENNFQTVQGDDSFYMKKNRWKADWHGFGPRG